MYDPATNSWITRAAMPSPRWRAAGVVLGGLFYVIGGRDAAGNYVYYEATKKIQNDQKPRLFCWKRRQRLWLRAESLNAIA